MKFLNNALNKSYLFIKVTLIFASNGAMQEKELRLLTLHDIEKKIVTISFSIKLQLIVVTLRNTKTKKKQVFIKTSKAYGIELYQKYRRLTQQNISHFITFFCN